MFSVAFSRIGLNSLAAFALFFLPRQDGRLRAWPDSECCAGGPEDFFELFNDVKAAIEVNFGEGWHILYPEKSRKFELGDFPVSPYA